MADLGVSELAQLMSSGGAGVLAVLVYLELRAIRPILRSLDRVTTALLERERQRTGPIRLPDIGFANKTED